jgi:SAM-dependent methyltransferase
MNASGSALRRWLALPDTSACDIDDPETTRRRREIVRAKPFLRRIYEEWYGSIQAALPPGDEPILELGSGAGFLAERISRVIASDVMVLPDIDLVADAGRLPIRADALRGIVMTNVFHHVPDVRGFLRDAARVVRTGGAIVMIEPWVTTWSTIVYTRFHHEPFDTRAPEWTVPQTGPLSGANGALPWIVFERDRERFARECPGWRVASIEPVMPFRYLLSGGVSLRCLVPNWTFGFWRALERGMTRWMRPWGMFARIVLVRTAADP